MMALEQIAPHVDELTRALGEEIDREEIEAELTRYVEYGVPVEQAKQDLLRRYGGRTSTDRNVEDLTPGEQGVNVLVRVQTVNDKEIEVEGEPRTIHYGMMGDVTGTVSYTAWHDFDLEPDTVVRVRNAYVKEWGGSPELTLGDYTSVEPEDPGLLPAESVPRPSREVEVADMRGGQGSVTCTVRVLEVGEKEITVEGEPRTIWEGEVADATGKARLTCWQDYGLEEGQVVAVKGGYVRSWRGLPTLNLGDYAEVEVLDDDALPPADELDGSPVTALHALLERGGGYDVRTVGTVLEVKQGSGLIARCPECNRAVQKGQCRVHGDVDATPDLRTKATLDDGTAAATLILDRELTEELLGKTLEECREQAQEAMSTEVVADELADALVARQLEVRGNAMTDDWGLQLLGREVAFPEVDVQAEAARRLEEVA